MLWNIKRVRKKLKLKILQNRKFLIDQMIMAFYWEKMNVHPTGIEPVTFGFVDRCSIQLSYRCKSFNVMNIGLKYPEVNATGLFVLVKPLNFKRNQH